MAGETDSPAAHEHTPEEEKKIQSLARFFQLRHKISFVAGVLNIWFSAMLLASAPSLYYVWHTAKGVPLLIVRVFRFAERKWIFFLLDFCYWVNMLFFVYLWLLPEMPGLFRILFFFANGPLLTAIPLFNNSLVFHSVDHMTSLWLHFSPAVTTWCIRWFSTHDIPESLEPIAQHVRRRFHVCATEACTSMALFDHLGVYGSILHIAIPMAVLYGLWVAVYVLIVFYVEREVIEKNHYELLLDSPVVKSVTRPLGGSAAAYFVVHALYSLVLCAFTLYLWDNFLAHGVMLFVMGSISAWNGAGFYFDYFAKKYLDAMKTRAERKLHLQ